MAGATLIGGGVPVSPGQAEEAAAGGRGEVGEAVTGEAGPGAGALEAGLTAPHTLTTCRIRPAARAALRHAGPGLKWIMLPIIKKKVEAFLRQEVFTTLLVNKVSHFILNICLTRFSNI